jgi:hypothetical protein
LRTARKPQQATPPKDSQCSSFEVLENRRFARSKRAAGSLEDHENLRFSNDSESEADRREASISERGTVARTAEP